MQFQVPQFIEVEDKIFGPLTLKQFLYLAGGAAIVFLLYATLPLFLVILLGPAVAGFALALAFYKMHGQPFIKVVENALRHSMKAKVYTWKKRDAVPQKAEKIKTQDIKPSAPQIPVPLPKLTKSKLDELSWSLDIKTDQDKK